MYVCQHEYFRGPTLSGGNRASPERGHTTLQGGLGLEGLEGLDGGRDGDRMKDTEKRKRWSMISSNVRTLNNRKDLRRTCKHQISHNEKLVQVRRTQL